MQKTKSYNTCFLCLGSSLAVTLFVFHYGTDTGKNEIYLLYININHTQKNIRYEILTCTLVWFHYTAIVNINKHRSRIYFFMNFHLLHM